MKPTARIKKSKQGGARRGSGRKPGGHNKTYKPPLVPLHIRIDAYLKEEFDRRRKKKRMSGHEFFAILMANQHMQGQNGEIVC